MYDQESQLVPTTGMPGGENAAPGCRYLQPSGQTASPSNMVEAKDKCGAQQQSPVDVRVGAMLDGNPSNAQTPLVGYNQRQLANDPHTPRPVEIQASGNDSGCTQSVIGQNISSDNVHPLSNESSANKGGILHPTTSPPTSKEQASTVVAPAGIGNQDSHNNEHQPVSFLPHMTSPLRHPPGPFDPKSVAHGKHWEGNGTVHPAFNAEKQMCHDHGAAHRRHAVLPTNSAQCQGDYTENYCNRPEYNYNVPTYNTDSYNGHSNDQGYNNYQNYGPQEAGYMQWESLNHYGDRHNMCMYGPPNPYGGLRLCTTPQGHRDHVYKPDTYQDNYSDSLSSPSPDRASFSSSNEHVGYPNGNLMYGYPDSHHFPTQKKSKRKRNKTKRGCDISGLSGIKAQMDETVILQLPSEPPKSIPEAVCMYIDYLIAENEAKTEISKADTPDYLDVDYTEEDYLQEVLHKQVEFPTTKFQEWLRLYNFEVQVCGTPKKRRPSNEDFSKTNPHAKIATTMNMSQVDKSKPATKGAIDIHITRPIYPEMTSEDSKAVQSLIANTLTHNVPNPDPVSSEKVQNVRDNQCDRAVRNFQGDGPTKNMAVVQRPKLPGFQSTFGSWEAGVKTDNIEGLSARKTSNISTDERKSLHDDQILIKLAEEAGINLATPEIQGRSPDMKANRADTLLTNNQDSAAKSGNPSAYPENTWTRVNFDSVTSRTSEIGEPESVKPGATTITPVTERQTVSGPGTECNLQQESSVSGGVSSVAAQQKVDVEQKLHEVTGNATSEASSRVAPVAVSHTNETIKNEIEKDPVKEQKDEGTTPEPDAAATYNMSIDTNVPEGASANQAENISNELEKRGTEIGQDIKSDRFESTKFESKLVTVGESKCSESEPEIPVTETQRSTSHRSRETAVSASKRAHSLRENAKGDEDSTPEKKLRRN